MNDCADTLNLKQLIEELTVPLIFKKHLKWNLMNWSLEDWKDILKDQIMDFRVGLFKSTNAPQWERTSVVVKATFSYFLEQVKLDPGDKWLYFDYKHLCNNLTQCQDLRDAIKWEDIGLQDIGVDQSTIWIGSRGAHTPCHIDTYGCNLILQVYGRKLWLVFPPETNLKPTRVPYEESSIYSKLNFFSPTISHFKGVENCRQVILEPGDVLFLPHGWWHYVENLETSISINTWLPLEIDDEERLKESIVQFFVKQMVNLCDSEARNIILNPNMEEIVDGQNDNLLQTITLMRSICLQKQQSKKNKLNASQNTATSSCVNMENIAKKYENIHEVPVLTQQCFQLLLKQQNDRFAKQNEEEDVNINRGNSVQEILEVFTDDEVVSLIKEKLLCVRNIRFKNVDGK